jgi:uncharacterized protein
MNAVTYSLKQDKNNSQEYYDKIRELTDEVIVHSTEILEPLINEFMDYLQNYELEQLRDRREYLLELISFGVLWNSYAHTALSVKHAPFIVMAHMAEWRKKHQQIKPLIDFARGILITLVLLPKIKHKHDYEPPTLEQIDQVCRWFEATGEFREQALRFVRWRAYWATNSEVEVKKRFYAIAVFTKWFEAFTIKSLGKYTENVESFLNNSAEQYKWREDRISSTRLRIEYHLNMIGAELMNRAFRDDYKNTDTKVVLMPGCMRTHNDENCKAIRIKEGLKCSGCEAQCRINQLREMGKKNNFDVYIIPHASDLSQWSPQPGKPRRGVVASACVTTLVEGGWELKRYDVPAQCVLLDYSGCKKHWHCKGVPTELNIRELRRILNLADRIEI